MSRETRHSANRPSPKSLSALWKNLTTPSITSTLALVLIITAINAVWVARDHTGPSWDQSHYLTITWMFQQALDHHGPVALVRAIYTIDPGRAPLFVVAMLPFSYIFHNGPETGLALNVVMWPLLLLSAGAIAKHFFNERARILTILALAPMPGLVYLSHTQLQDFMLATIGTFAVWLIVRTDDLERRGVGIALGIVLGLGTLTKISFVVIVAGPLLVAIGARFVTGLRTKSADRWHSLIRPTTNLGLTGIIALGMSALWYVPNWAATRAYLHLALELQPGTVAHPLALSNLEAFAFAMVNAGVGLLFLLLALAVIAMHAPRLLRWRSLRWPARSSTVRFLFLVSWLVIPIAAVAVSSNQAERYAVSALPPAAILFGGLASTLQFASIRRVTVGLLGAVAIDAMLVTSVAGFRLPVVPAVWSFSTPAGTAYAILANTDSSGRAGIPFTPLPENYTLNMIRYLEDHSRGSDGRIEPRTVALLELQGYLNGNDLPYYADIRHDPFTFTTLFRAPSTAALAAELKTFDFALYIGQPHDGQGVVEQRISELNATAAARQMTPALFSIFKPHPAKLFAGFDQSQDNYVFVLERR
jgi:4-amino-4-deoxy-L-arabinose transferase-like glycosyltransferase